MVLPPSNTSVTRHRLVLPPGNITPTGHRQVLLPGNMTVTRHRLVMIMHVSNAKVLMDDDTSMAVNNMQIFNNIQP